MLNNSLIIRILVITTDAHIMPTKTTIAKAIIPLLYLRCRKHFLSHFRCFVWSVVIPLLNNAFGFFMPIK